MNTKTNSRKWSWIQLNERRATRTAMLLLLLLLIMPVSGAQGAVVFTTLYSFNGTNDGFFPNGLAQGSDGYFYGTTEYGGAYTNQYNESYGTVFKISTNGVLTNLYSFTGGRDGAHPRAALVQGSDGYFYGTTSLGGANGTAIGGYGTVFKLSTNGALTTLYAFGSVQDINGAPLEGANPSAALVQGSEGYFYGTTSDGGTNGGGTVFTISTNGALTSLYSFTGGNDGAFPGAALLRGSDGNFYGTTSQGGLTNLHPDLGSGTVFKISPVGALTTLYTLALHKN